MKLAIVTLGVSAVLLAGAAAHAATRLMPVTPSNAKDARFTVTSKAGPKNTIEFVIRRDIQGLSAPGRAAYLTDSSSDDKSIGTRLKLEEDKDKTLTFRFSVPESRVATSIFTLWGPGAAYNGVTHELRLAAFHKK